MGGCQSRHVCGDELGPRHNPDPELCHELLTSAVVYEGTSVIGNENVATVSNVGSQDHGVTQLPSLTSAEVLAFAWRWKRVIADDLEEAFKPIGVILAAPETFPPDTLAPHKGFLDSSQVLEFDSEI